MQNHIIVFLNLISRGVSNIFFWNNSTKVEVLIKKFASTSILFNVIGITKLSLHFLNYNISQTALILCDQKVLKIEKKGGEGIMFKNWYNSPHKPEDKKEAGYHKKWLYNL